MLNGESLALIVCTYRRAAAVTRLLGAVSRQTAIPDEVLIVDASPDRDTELAVAEWRSKWTGGRIVYVAAPSEHRGLTRQRNYGAARTTCGLVAFLDDDTIPARDYFEQLQSCAARHPEAAGFGGYILGAADWRLSGASPSSSLDTFAWEGWVRRDDYRWRLRRMLGLASPMPPGWMPPGGHGRPVSYLPPDGKDYQVEFVMGGAAMWRRSVLERHRFSERFEGYGLYEDLDFCIRVSRDSPLFVCTKAQLEHHHDPAARPDAFRYGTMVVRNGWYVWRERWPTPSGLDRFKWWTTTALLTACRAADALRGSEGFAAVKEAAGRCWGMMSLPSTSQDRA
jgi:GT2 family glycosyltransferase